MSQQSVSIERLTEIAGEVMDLMETQDVFGFLDSSTGNMRALEVKLQEVMMERQKYECIELAMYLRTSFSRQTHLPSWQPLCNAAVDLALQRNESLEMFYGLISSEHALDRNTSRLTGPRHPQMRKR